MVLAVQLRVSLLEVESDSSGAVKLITEGDTMLHLYGQIVDDYRTLASRFQGVKFKHVMRECNVVADHAMI